MSNTNLVLLTLFFIVLILFSFIYVNLDHLRGLFIGLFKNTRVNAKFKKFAIDHDFPLLSNVVIQISEDKYVKIDHIMIGNKYIYVIKSNCWYGYLNGKAIDDKWLLYRKDKLIHLDNPLKYNRVRIKMLSALLENSIDDFVNVIYLAKPVVVNKIESNKEREFVLFEDDFAKFIEIYEKECKLNEFSLKSIEGAAKKIFDYHKESFISFKEINKKKEI